MQDRQQQTDRGHTSFFRHTLTLQRLSLTRHRLTLTGQWPKLTGFWTISRFWDKVRLCLWTTACAGGIGPETVNTRSDGWIGLEKKTKKQIFTCESMVTQKNKVKSCWRQLICALMDWPGWRKKRKRKLTKLYFYLWKKKQTNWNHFFVNLFTRWNYVGDI